jgi:hypothetical protein
MPFTMSAGRGAESEIITEQTLSGIKSEKFVLKYLPANIKMFRSELYFRSLLRAKYEGLTALRGKRAFCNRVRKIP